MALAAAAPADAYVMVATVTGTVGTVSHSGATFAPVAGDPFTAVIAFNSDPVGVVTTPTKLSVTGGICCVNPSPAYSGTLTINGVTEDLFRDLGTPFDSTIVYDAAAGTVLFSGGRDDFVDSNLTIKMSGAAIPLSLDAAFSLTQDAGSSFRFAPLLEPIDQAQLIPTSLTVVRTVPEPATWAMMLLGFFGLGAALRRTRRAAALAA